MQASQCGNQKVDMIAFLRRHYPDQVRGTGRQYVTSQPACASTPWIVALSYHGAGEMSRKTSPPVSKILLLVAEVCAVGRRQLFGPVADGLQHAGEEPQRGGLVNEAQAAHQVAVVK